jgi:hypothetical protein
MLKKFGVLMAALTMVVALGACTVEQTEEGEMPEVNVEGGNMPEYDVDAADVDITTDTATITVPDVDVSTETRQVTVPDVDVNPPQN